MVEGGRGAAKGFRPGRSRTGVVVSSAVGPVVRGVTVSSAGRGRLAVLVVSRVPAGFGFVFASGVAGFVVQFVLRVRAVIVGFVVWAEEGLLMFVVRDGTVFRGRGVVEKGFSKGHKNNEIIWADSLHNEFIRADTHNR